MAVMESSLKEKLLQVQRTYICIKTLRKVALLALLFEVILRLILQLKIFNYWVVLFWVFFFSYHGS